MNSKLSARLDKAGLVLNRAEALFKEFDKDKSLRTTETVHKQLAPIMEPIEEAQQLLFDEQDEVEDKLPDPDEALVEEQEEGKGESQEKTTTNPYVQFTPEPEKEEVLDPAVEQFIQRKGQLEQRSRLLEASVCEAAARRLAPSLDEGKQATEDQEKLLASAVSALVAYFEADQDPMILVRIAELDVMRREVKRAKLYLAKVLELAPEGEPGERAKALLEKINSDPSIKDKSKCFIATAAMGSADASEVRTLRAFRDKVLMKHSAGRLLVAAYYEVSPPVARILEKHERLRTATARYFIQPLAKAARRVPGIE